VMNGAKGWSGKKGNRRFPAGMTNPNRNPISDHHATADSLWEREKA
jgi:hypothetical protein